MLRVVAKIMLNLNLATASGGFLHIRRSWLLSWLNLNNAMNESPPIKSKRNLFKKKRFTINEYSNLINRDQSIKRVNKSLNSNKRKPSRDLDYKQRNMLSYKEILTSSNKHKSRSKRPKSSKFTFLTINNYGCKRVLN